MTFRRIHQLRIGTAIVVLILALLYLMGQEKTALAGFALITMAAVAVGDRLRKGTLPATCDLCGASATMAAEYGAGFSNARLVLTCPRCGRVINSGGYQVEPRREKEHTSTKH